MPRSVMQPKMFARGLLANADALLYTAPAAAGVTTATVKVIWFSNTDSVSHQITLYMVEKSGASADNRSLMKSVAINPNTTYIVSCADALASEEMIRGFADVANKIAYRISGVEYVWV